MHLDYIIGNETTQFTGHIRSYLDEPTAEASDWTDDELDRKSTRLNSSHIQKSRMPSSA